MDIGDSQLASGLCNLGNTCFLNCIIQVIASSFQFCEYVEKLQVVLDKAGAKHELNHILNINTSESPISNSDVLLKLLGLICRQFLHVAIKHTAGPQQKENKKRHEGSLIAALRRLLSELGSSAFLPIASLSGSINNGSSSTRSRSRCDASEVLHALQASVSEDQLEWGLQHDAVETFELLCDALEAERARLLMLPTSPWLLPETLTPESSHRCPDGVCSPDLICGANRSAASPFTTPPARGYMSTRMHCHFCGNSFAEQLTPFWCLSLPLPYTVSGPGFAKVQQGITLEHLLHRFTQSEQLAGVICDRCSLRASLALHSMAGHSKAIASRAASNVVSSISQECSGNSSKGVSIHHQPISTLLWNTPSHVTEPQPSYAPEPQPSYAPEPQPSYAPEPQHSLATEPQPSHAIEPRPLDPTQPQHSHAIQPQPSRATEPQPLYPTQPQPSYATESQPSHATEPRALYPTQSQPSHAPESQPLYPTQPQPSYPTQSQPSYASEPQPATLAINPWPSLQDCGVIYAPQAGSSANSGEATAIPSSSREQLQSDLSAGPIHRRRRDTDSENEIALAPKLPMQDDVTNVRLKAGSAVDLERVAVLATSSQMDLQSNESKPQSLDGSIDNRSGSETGAPPMFRMQDHVNNIRLKAGSAVDIKQVAVIANFPKMDLQSNQSRDSSLDESIDNRSGSETGAAPMFRMQDHVNNIRLKAGSAVDVEQAVIMAASREVALQLDQSAGCMLDASMETDSGHEIAPAPMSPIQDPGISLRLETGSAVDLDLEQVARMTGSRSIHLQSNQSAGHTIDESMDLGSRNEAGPAPVGSRASLPNAMHINLIAQGKIRPPTAKEINGAVVQAYLIRVAALRARSSVPRIPTSHEEDVVTRTHGAAVPMILNNAERTSTPAIGCRVPVQTGSLEEAHVTSARGAGNLLDLNNAQRIATPPIGCRVALQVGSLEEDGVTSVSDVDISLELNYLERVATASGDIGDSSQVNGSLSGRAAAGVSFHTSSPSRGSIFVQNLQNPECDVPCGSHYVENSSGSLSVPRLVPGNKEVVRDPAGDTSCYVNGMELRVNSGSLPCAPPAGKASGQQSEVDTPRDLHSIECSMHSETVSSVEPTKTEPLQTPADNAAFSSNGTEYTVRCASLLGVSSAADLLVRSSAEGSRPRPSIPAVDAALAQNTKIDPPCSFHALEYSTHRNAASGTQPTDKELMRFSADNTPYSVDSMEHRTSSIPLPCTSPAINLLGRNCAEDRLHSLRGLEPGSYNASVFSVPDAVDASWKDPQDHFPRGSTSLPSASPVLGLSGRSCAEDRLCSLSRLEPSIYDASVPSAPVAVDASWKEPQDYFPRGSTSLPSASSTVELFGRNSVENIPYSLSGPEPSTYNMSVHIGNAAADDLVTSSEEDSACNPNGLDHGVYKVFVPSVPSGAEALWRESQHYAPQGLCSIGHSDGSNSTPYVPSVAARHLPAPSPPCKQEDPNMVHPARKHNPGNMNGCAIASGSKSESLREDVIAGSGRILGLSPFCSGVTSGEELGLESILSIREGEDGKTLLFSNASFDSHEEISCQIETGFEDLAEDVAAGSGTINGPNHLCNGDTLSEVLCLESVRSIQEEGPKQTPPFSNVSVQSQDMIDSQIGSEIKVFGEEVARSCIGHSVCRPCSGGVSSEDLCSENVHGIGKEAAGKTQLFSDPSAHGHDITDYQVVSDSEDLQCDNKSVSEKRHYTNPLYNGRLLSEALGSKSVQSTGTEAVSNDLPLMNSNLHRCSKTDCQIGSASGTRKSKSRVPTLTALQDIARSVDLPLPDLDLKQLLSDLGLACIPVKRLVSRSTYVARLPEVLCLQLQRTVWTPLGEHLKVYGTLPFPLTLNASPLLTPGAALMKSSTVNHVTSSCGSDVFVGGESGHSARHMYRLTAVVVHLGGVGSGHYLMYRRVATLVGVNGAQGGTWFRISDADVSEASISEVMTCEACMLCYERAS